MTTTRVRATQTAQPPKPARMRRGVVTQVSPLTVQIGGAAVAGLPIPGATYAVGDPVLVLWQEPGIGPVYPLTVPPPVDVDGVFQYAGTGADWDAGGWRTSISRSGKTGKLTLALRPGGSGLAIGATIGTIPTGFRPLMNTVLIASVYSPGWNGATAHLQLNREADGGAVILAWAAATLGASALISGSITYPLP